MGGNVGPIGQVGSISTKDRPVIEMTAAHGLVEGALVRIRQEGARTECYVKPENDTRFAVYADSHLQQQANLEGFAQGAMVDALNSDHWALVAGISYYPAIRDLKGAVDDATAFKNWVQDSGYVPDQQTIWIQPPSQRPSNVDDANPKAADIYGGFKKLLKAANQKDFHYLGRRVYFFFSGHGIVPSKSGAPDYREASLLTADAEPDLMTDQYVGLRSWAEWFRSRGIFDEVFLFADCCRHMDHSLPPMPVGISGWEPMRGEGQPFYAFATKLDSTAWEQELGKPKRVRGVLSFVVTEALKNRKLYLGGSLTAYQLQQHIYKSVPEYSNKQEALVEHDNNPEKPIVIAKWPRQSATKQAVQINFEPPIAGAIADIFPGNDTRRLLVSHGTDDGPWIEDLDVNSLYKVVIRDTGRKSLFETTANDEVQVVNV